ncbi:PIG-L family deacetylase [Streptomyces sp. NPDC047315]|uniref:PIG-L deacetylase family protein n=1 Tax=Streptomyces sp. NPDC047315 TaxID=3155142 RepID=UPI0033E736AC
MTDPTPTPTHSAGPDARGVVARLRGGRTLLVSPHPDDVAYSCGGTLAAVGRPADATLLTVFTRSAWALQKRLRRAGPDVISARRHQEELRYCQLRGVGRYLSLGFADASLRGYDEVTEVTSSAADDALRDKVDEAVAQAVRDFAADTVLAPAAVGGHIDHRLVHDAVRGATGTGALVLFYEDLPYAGQRELGAVERLLRQEQRLVPFDSVDITTVVQEKVRGMYVYGSQTDDECVREALHHSRRTPSDGRPAARAGGAVHRERLWAAAGSPGHR